MLGILFLLADSRMPSFGPGWDILSAGGAEMPQSVAAGRRKKLDFSCIPVRPSPASKLLGLAGGYNAASGLSTACFLGRFRAK